jgi:PAS domain S-box-containing protein
MTFYPNIYSSILLAAGLCTLLLCLHIFRGYDRMVRWFGYMVLCIAIWGLSYGFGLASNQLPELLFWINVEYLGVSFAPACWLFFVLKFTGKEEWISRSKVLMAMVIPLITLLLVWTNPYHHWYYASVSVDRSGPLPLLSIQRGPWYFVHTAYFYLCMACGVLLLIHKFRKSNELFKWQNLIILVGAFIPWIANVLYFAGFRPLGHIDSTPFSLTLTVLLLSIGLFRFRLLDIKPIARERVIESMKEGLIVADHKDRIVDLNREIHGILGVTPSRLIGKDLRHILPGQERLYEMIRSRSAGLVQIEIPKMGQPVYLEVRLSPLFEQTGMYSGIIILFRDITHRVNTEKQIRMQASQLLALNKLKDRLFSIISHDLRSPLLNLFDIIRMLDEKEMTEQEFRDMLPKLSRNVGYTSALLENLLYWSKSQLQGEVLKPVEIDLKACSAAIIHLFERAIEEKELQIVQEIGGSDVIYADKAMIELVIRNLVSNAIKFSMRGGKISLTSNSCGTLTTLCVEDEGVGIAQEDLSKLFESESFTTPGTENEQGTGLGLLLCKDFIEKNKGRIWVERRRPKGSAFYIELPARLNEEKLQRPAAAEL